MIRYNTTIKVQSILTIDPIQINTIGSWFYFFFSIQIIIILKWRRFSNPINECNVFEIQYKKKKKQQQSITTTTMKYHRTFQSLIDQTLEYSESYLDYWDTKSLYNPNHKQSKLLQTTIILNLNPPCESIPCESNNIIIQKNKHQFQKNQGCKQQRLISDQYQDQSLINKSVNESDQADRFERILKKGEIATNVVKNIHNLLKLCNNKQLTNANKEKLDQFYDQLQKHITQITKHILRSNNAAKSFTTQLKRIKLEKNAIGADIIKDLQQLNKKKKSQKQKKNQKRNNGTINQIYGRLMEKIMENSERLKLFQEFISQLIKFLEQEVKKTKIINKTKNQKTKPIKKEMQKGKKLKNNTLAKRVFILQFIKRAVGQFKGNIKDQPFKTIAQSSTWNMNLEAQTSSTQCGQ